MIILIFADAKRLWVIVNHNIIMTKQFDGIITRSMNIRTENDYRVIYNKQVVTAQQTY
jgi:phosphotransferase system IIB component